MKDELQPERAASRSRPIAPFRSRPTRGSIETSGTHGRPLAVLDTPDDWQWWIDCWQFVLDAAEMTPSDRALLAFSFGPFIGFWSAFDALVARGALAIPGGGMSSLARIELLRTHAGDGAVLHAELCAAPGGGGGGAQDRSGPFVGGEDRRGRRAGRQRAGDSRADRAGLGRAGHRSRGRDGGRPVGLCRRRRPRPARQRIGVHRRVCLGRNRRAGRARASWRT